MASKPTEAPMVKPSFAKVAAKAYNPQKPQEFSPDLKPSKNQKSPVILQNPSHMSMAAKPLPEHSGSNLKRELREQPRRGEINLNRLAAANTAQVNLHDLTQSGGTTQHARVHMLDGHRHIENVAGPSAADDGATQLSSSDGSGKPPSLDGKSVASGATFALDEKESIRPDESASTRAVEEEDMFSAPGSVAADATGSRVGSDSGCRAFREQLHEISVMGPLPRRDFAQGTCPPPAIPVQAGVLETTPRALPLTLQEGVIAGGMVSQAPVSPDPKLLEALANPRDRLFVLKLEQDIIDFLNNPKEKELCLPHCNSFYRLLAHRLADYYRLYHHVDESLTSVKIAKTPVVYMPPSLVGITGIPSMSSSPAPSIPARKIMRREDAKTTSGTNTAANSEGPSKATSEVEGESGSDGGTGSADGAKPKASMTREEREAKYREARQRIFGSSEDTESGDNNAPSRDGNSAEDKDASRSSSASGKRKNKKQRNYNDDGFDARSQYNVIYPSPYGYTGDGAPYVYGPYPAMMPMAQYPPLASPVPSAVGYNHGFHSMMQSDVSGQYSWAQQTYPGNPTSMPAYGTPLPNSFDLSADFQRGMQSFQTTSPIAQASAKLASYPPGFHNNFPPQPQLNQSWQQMPFPNPYPTPPQTYAQPQYGDRPLSSSGPVPPTNGFYVPAANQNCMNGKPNRNQPPHPAGFNRPSFNPQSQTFVPAIRGGSYNVQAPQLVNNAVGNFGGIPMQIQSQQMRPSPPTSHPPTFTPPRAIPSQVMNSKPTSQGPCHPLPQPVTAQPLSTQSGPPQSAAVPAPLQSSIAKFTPNPASLPPKPPPPASSLPKHLDGQRSLPNPVYAVPSRLPSNLPTNFTPNMVNGVIGANPGGRNSRVV